jgi:outer membrane protein assembly factor BamB
VSAPAGLLFVGANNGVFFCFDYINRQERWAFQTGGPIKSTAALSDGLIYVTSWDSKLYALDRDRGLAHLQFGATAASMSSPAAVGGTVYFGADDGVLYAVGMQSGVLGWSFSTSGPILSSPTVIADSGLVVVGSRDRHVYLIDAATGGLRQTLALGSGVSSVPVAVDTWLFVNDDSGTLYAFRSAVSE